MGVTREGLKKEKELSIKGIFLSAVFPRGRGIEELSSEIPFMFHDSC